MADESKQLPTERQQRRQQFWNKYRNSRKKHSKSKDAGTRRLPATEKVQMKLGENISVGSDLKDEEESEKKRYLLFVGNLPFTVAAKEVKRHFRCAGGVVDFRLMTKKETEESKGCGFLEFDNAGSMRKALNLHHSELGGRKINVELTCGGGGKGEKRGKRLINKKRKLRQERKEKSSKLKAETGNTETSSVPESSSQTEKLASGAVCPTATVEQRNEKSKDRSKKRTGTSKGMGKRKTGVSDGSGKMRRVKHRDHSGRGIAAGRKRKPKHQNTSGFRRAKVSRQES